ncbi:nestin [Spea bombifrons]|uniref:nestin n=1 Tax=Spea bombifrons TaxID=233779 RepID=UPI00234B8F7E|nr:nestin [Spea bombifrons]
MESYVASLSLGEESTQMWTLNKRLEAYLSRVKALEEENESLRAEIHHLKSTKSERCWKKKFHDEMRKLRKAMDESYAEMVEAEMARDSICEEIEFIKERCLQERQAQEDAKKELSESKKVLEEEVRAQNWLKERLLQLEEELEDILKVHEEEKELMEQEISQFSQRLENFRVAPVAFQPVDVDDYAKKLSEIWHGAVEGYKSEVSALENSLTEANENLRKVQEENRQSKMLLHSLDKELQSLKTRKEMLEELLSKQWQEQQEEGTRLQFEVETLEKEKQDLRAQIAQVLEDRQQLMHLKMSLSLEVATYRSLLEAESTRIYPSGMEYKLSNTFNDSVMGQKSFNRSRQNEANRKLAPREYRPSSGKTRTAEKTEVFRPSTDLFLNVKTSQKRASPVTKEFQKVSSVLQSQSTTKAPVAKTATSLSTGKSDFERYSPSVNVYGKTKIESSSNSYSVSSSKADDKKTVNGTRDSTFLSENGHTLKDKERKGEKSVNKDERDSIFSTNHEAPISEFKELNLESSLRTVTATTHEELTSDFVQEDDKSLEIKNDSREEQFHEKLNEEPKPQDVPKHEMLDDSLPNTVSQKKVSENTEVAVEREILSEAISYQRVSYNQQELAELHVDTQIDGGNEAVEQEAKELDKDTDYTCPPEVSENGRQQEITIFQSTEYEDKDFELLSSDNDNVSEIIRQTVGGLLGSNFQIASVTETEYVHYQEDNTQEPQSFESTNDFDQLISGNSQWVLDSEGSIQVKYDQARVVVPGEEQENISLQNKELEHQLSDDDGQSIQNIEEPIQQSQIFSILQQVPKGKFDIEEGSLQHEEDSSELGDEKLKDGQMSPSISNTEKNAQFKLTDVQAEQPFDIDDVVNQLDDLKQDTNQLSEIEEDSIQVKLVTETHFERSDAEPMSTSEYEGQLSDIEKESQDITESESNVEETIQSTEYEERVEQLSDVTEGPSQSFEESNDLPPSQEVIHLELHNEDDERKETLNVNYEEEDANQFVDVEHNSQGIIDSEASSQLFSEGVAEELSYANQDDQHVKESEEANVETEDAESHQQASYQRLSQSNSPTESSQEEASLQETREVHESHEEIELLDKNDSNEGINDQRNELLENTIHNDDDFEREVEEKLNDATEDQNAREDIGDQQLLENEYETAGEQENVFIEKITYETKVLFTEEDTLRDQSELQEQRELSEDLLEASENQYIVGGVHEDFTVKEEYSNESIEENEIEQIKKIEETEKTEECLSEDNNQDLLTPVNESVESNNIPELGKAIEDSEEPKQDAQELEETDSEKSEIIAENNTQVSLDSVKEADDIKADDGIPAQSITEDLPENEGEIIDGNEEQSDYSEASFENPVEVIDVHHAELKNEEDLAEHEVQSYVLEQQEEHEEQGSSLEEPVDHPTEVFYVDPKGEDNTKSYVAEEEKEHVEHTCSSEVSAEDVPETFDVDHAEYQNEEDAAEAQSLAAEQQKELQDIHNENSETIYSQEEVSEFEPNKDYHLEKTLPDTTPLPNLDNESEDVSEEPVTLTGQVNITQDDEEQLIEESGKHSLLTDEFVTGSIEESEEMDAKLSTKEEDYNDGDGFPALDVDTEVQKDTSDRETSNLRDNEFPDNAVTNMVAEEDISEDHIDLDESQYKAPEVQATEANISQEEKETKDPIELDEALDKDNSEGHGQFAEDMPEVAKENDQQNTSSECVALDTVLLDNISHQEEQTEVEELGDSVSESEESGSFDENSPNATTVSETSQLETSRTSITEETHPEMEETDEITTSSKEHENVGLENSEDKETKEVENIFLEGSASAPNDIVELETRSTDQEKEEVTESSNSSYDSNDTSELDGFKENIDNAGFELNKDSENVNGLPASENLDSAKNVLNGHSNGERSEHELSGKKGFILLEESEDIHTQAILHDSIISFAMPERKDEGLFQSLLEPPQPKDSSIINELSAEESQFTKLVEDPALSYKSFSDQPETSSFTSESVAETSQQSHEIHEGIFDIKVQYGNENSWSSED